MMEDWSWNPGSQQFYCNLSRWNCWRQKKHLFFGLVPAEGVTDNGVIAFLKALVFVMTGGDWPVFGVGTIRCTSPGTVWCSRSNVIKECDLAKLEKLMFHPLSLWHCDVIANCYSTDSKVSQNNSRQTKRQPQPDGTSLGEPKFSIAHGGSLINGQNIEGSQCHSIVITWLIPSPRKKTPPMCKSPTKPCFPGGVS